uniref:THAP-type domain-containing protein n=1 Tax=Lepeophtheirus salmonis TaxID=72036 RepID=A0A0K2TNV0_LEPSM
MASSRGSKRVCAMACCPNPRDAQYFAFPQKKLMLQRLWISVCRRKDSINIKNAKICDRHFTSNDFERNLQAELLDLKARKKLKSDAVPSLHIPFASPSSDEPKSSRDIRKETRERKELVKQLLEASKVQETSMDSETKTDNEGSIEICSGINESQQEPSTKTQSTQIDVYKFEKGVQCEEGSWPLFWERKCKKLQKELSLTKKELCRYKTKCKLLNSKKFKQNLIRTSLEKSHSKIQVRKIIDPLKNFNRGYSRGSDHIASHLERPLCP